MSNQLTLGATSPQLERNSSIFHSIRAGRWLDAGGGVLRRRWFIIPIAIFAVAIMLVSGLPPANTWGKYGNSGLSVANVPPPPTKTFYPYVVSPASYPAPYTLTSQVPGASYLWPRIVATVNTGGNPIYDMFVVAYYSGNGTGIPYFIQGSYSATIAKQILNGTATTSIPIQWGTPVRVTAYHGSDLHNLPLLNSQGFPFSTNAAITSAGTAFAASPEGLYLFAAVSDGTSTSENCSANGGSGWIPHSTISGSGPNMAYGTYSALLVTHTSTDIYASFLYCTRATDYTGTIAASAVNAAPVWVANATSGGASEAGVVATLTYGSVAFYGSVDGGHHWTTSYIGAYVPTPQLGALSTVGSTKLQDPGGWPGQISATTSGSSMFVVYTTYVNGQVLAQTSVSSNYGATWNAPQTTPLASGSVADPAATSSPAGYVYVAWQENGVGFWRIDQAVYTADGQLVQAPTPLTGSTQSNSPYSVEPTITVDAFQRPVVAWAGVNTSSLPQVGLSGAFLSPTTALSVLSNHIAELGTWDFKKGSPGSLVSSLDGFISTATTDIQTYIGSPRTDFSYLCKAQNETADWIYANDTHVAFQNESSPNTVCGNFAKV
jgi:hypothetical protein